MEEKPDSKAIKFYEKEGSVRATTSGSLSMMFALIGSTCVWLFLIVATGSDIIQYFGLTTAINGIVGVFAIGCARHFIAEIKGALIVNEELGRIKAAAYSKILILIGIALGIFMIIVSFFTENKLLRIAYFACGFSTISTYFLFVFWIGLEIRNRYDIIAFLNIFGGMYLLLWAFLFISFSWDPIWFAFHPFFNISTFFLFAYFFKKHAPHTFKDILKSRITSKGIKRNASPEVKELIEHNQIRLFLKNSTFSMITNLESLGIYGSLLIFLAAVYLPVETQGLGVSLLTIIFVYGAVKTVILYYSAPLNIECAEACTKDNQEIIEESINNSTRIASILALGFGVGIIALSPQLLLLLHGQFFYNNGKFDSQLFQLAQILFILIVIGQFSFGYCTLFGNALIGTGNARLAAFGFGVTLIIIIFATPILILWFGILGVGIAMIIAVLFLLPYMLIQIKRKLDITFNFRLKRIIPNVTILFLIFWFFPIKGMTGLFLSLIIGGLIYMMLNPFFGVSIPEDIQMINDLFTTLKLKYFGKFITASMKFTYNISPFNKDKIE